MRFSYLVGLFRFLCCLSLLNAAVNANEYEYDPNSIPHISTQKLKNIISSGNEAVLVYFYGDFKECPECQRLLPKFHEAVEYLHKLDDGKVVSYKLAMKFPEYGINILPQMVLFTQDTPFLYDGAGREEVWETNDILEWVEEAKQTPIQELTDETFEHLTQSSTGATTGDWIILFADRSKPECLKPHLAVMGTVGLRLRMRKNVAYVDTSSSKSICERFADVLPSTCASILFFHRTELYKVPMEEFSVSSILDFVIEGFHKVEHMDVPKVQSEPNPHLEQLMKTLNSFVEEYGRTHMIHAFFMAIITFLVLGVIFFLVKKFRKRKLL